MNQKNLFLGTVLLLGLALVLGLSACSRSNMTSSGNTLEKQTANYQVMVNLSTPLRTRTESYTLMVHDLKANKPLENVPKVTVEMPMGMAPMTAPTTLSKGTQPGEFKVESEFTMAGNWLMKVKPTPSSETITLTLPVQ